jgi:hypothetical protein
MKEKILIILALSFAALCYIGLTRYALPSLLTAGMAYLLAVLCMA